MRVWKMAVAAVMLASGAMAQTHSGHDQMMVETPLPTEPGQGAFAAIAEIVAALRANPHTDWSAVDIDALRAHLRDMALVTLEAEVFSQSIEGGLEMRISTAGEPGAAAARMVPAHGPVLAAETGWSSDLRDQDDALVWRVTSDRGAEQIRALGFWGLMATGDHHREHHLGMATGQRVH